MIRPVSRCALFLGTLALCGIAGAAGCRTLPPPTNIGALSIPPAGQVRVVSRQIEKTPNKLHWKWSLIGERNWRDARATDGALSLGKTYLLNDPVTSGGCNIWECDLVAEISSQTGAPGGLRWEATLHGSDGTTRKSGGVVSTEATAQPEDTVRIQVSHDALLTLPTDTVLAFVGDQKVTLKVAAD